MSYTHRTCASCEETRPSVQFSRNQWRKGVGGSRCFDCIGHSCGRSLLSDRKLNTGTGLNTARGNDNSGGIEFTWDEFARGANRKCYMGKYTTGVRKGQAAILKEFLSGEVYSARPWAQDIKASEQAVKLTRQFNGVMHGRWQIRVNLPGTLTVGQDEEVVLVEPFIHGFTKFNSNTGWTSQRDSDWDDILQALSHFSYHASSGQFVLCDLQGGVYRDGVVLTDPVILSRRAGAYGDTDLGVPGILNFFANHVCSHRCSDSWSQPKGTYKAFEAQESTLERGYDNGHAMTAYGGGNLYDDSDSSDDYYG